VVRWWSTVVQRQSTVVRHRRPSLTTTIDLRSPLWSAAVDRWSTTVDQWSGIIDRGGWTNGRMTRHRRYCSSSTRFGNKSILEADVAQGDWWIKNITAANDEI
nr:hypothetical protein [Tanacetum cinerariifolium]